MIKKTVITLTLGVTLFSSALFAEVMDTEQYATIATEVIRESMKGSGANTDKMVQQSEQLIQMGVASSRGYAASNPDYAKLLTLT